MCIRFHSAVALELAAGSDDNIASRLECISTCFVVPFLPLNRIAVVITPAVNKIAKIMFVFR